MHLLTKDYFRVSKTEPSGKHQSWGIQGSGKGPGGGAAGCTSSTRKLGVGLDCKTESLGGLWAFYWCGVFHLELKSRSRWPTEGGGEAKEGRKEGELGKGKEVKGRAGKFRINTWKSWLAEDQPRKLTTDEYSEGWAGSLRGSLGRLRKTRFIKSTAGSMAPNAPRSQGRWAPERCVCWVDR